jgi:hypothetical protein
MQQINQHIALAVVSIAGIASFAGIENASVLAQNGGNYEVMTVPGFYVNDTPEDKKTKRGLEQLVGSILLGSTSLQDQQNQRYFDAWYTRCYFPILTHPEHLGEWTDVRQKHLKMLAAPNMQRLLPIHDRLVGLTQQSMETILKGNYHPAARCNAMLLLGQLNSREAVLIGENKGLPEPLIYAMGVMLEALDDPQQIDAVRAAALVGILRHVQLDRQLPDAQRRLVGADNRVAEQRIVNAMLTLINTKQAPEGRTQGGHDWMRRRAVEILGYLGTPGANGEVLAALEAVMADNTSPVSLRCETAEALGRLQFPQDGNIAVGEKAKKLGGVAAFACYTEIKRVEDQMAREEKEGPAPSSASPYGAMGYPTAPGLFGGPTTSGRGDVFDPLAYRIALTRRRIKHQLLQVKRGLRGPDEKQDGGLLALTQPGQDQDYVKKVIGGIDTIVAVVDGGGFDDMKALTTELRSKVKKMEQDCGIAVEVTGAEDEGLVDENLLTNPLDIPGAIPGLEPPETAPAEPPAAPAGKPAPGPPAKPPAAPAAKPGGGPPAAPAAKPAAGPPAAAEFPADPFGG